MRSPLRLAAAALLLGLSGCVVVPAPVPSYAYAVNPYDPGSRSLAGAALGAGTGAALGAITGGGPGAAFGALTGGAIGALGGAVSTPPPPVYTYSPPPQPLYPSPGYYSTPSYYY